MENKKPAQEDSLEILTVQDSQEILVVEDSLEMASLEDFEDKEALKDAMQVDSKTSKETKPFANEELQKGFLDMLKILLPKFFEE